MINLTKRYRTQYYGEDIVTQKVLEQGTWSLTKEYVTSQISNQHLSSRAAVFGNGILRSKFDPNNIIKHKSGLLGKDTLQVYACNAFYRDYKPDFLIVTSDVIAKEVVESGYADENIVYTRVENTLKFPKKFYLIPQDPYADAGSTAAYIAAFDGHKHIYLFGFDGQDTLNYNNNIYAGTSGYDSLRTNIPAERWADNLKLLMDTYGEIDFVHVSESGRQRIPEKWKYCTNLRQISFREMVIETDL